ncbi:type I 3-dehydroquinate dehydratase [Methanococcus voltae]|uniref:3-dehydroquinate dehydratase n=1 Tax=Methanococcus voltae (strain ATCC BAA-1334 / A3) TaxID=456320 RepID=D7DTY4_METV3|nr:type I 3-dehydroquinate dehydratase [Methanococcus voltae]MCS3900394.1 3-dehydroquinate dehydratase-1 [Methanococcus voltae]
MELKNNTSFKICTAIIEETVDNSLKFVKNVNNKVYSKNVPDMYEFRLDYLDKSELDIKNIEKILKNESNKIITVRWEWEGGKWNNEKESIVSILDILKRAIELNVEYIDIEYNNLENVKEEIKQYRDSLNSTTKIIVSYHDFNKTDDFSVLKKEIIDKEFVHADIAKIATSVCQNIDNCTILKACSEYESKIIAIGMGELGKITRVYGTQFGSMFTFCTVSKEKASAPGQIHIDDLIEIWNKLYLE